MTGQRLPGEFDVIAKYFAPLAAENPGALGLVDDAALIAAAPGTETVATVDMLTAGVHFLIEDPPDLIARKLLRVNLSDLAAMGAVPRHYLLAIALPQDTDVAWLESFAAGLAEDQAAFGVCLAGGDTTSTPGPLTVSLTALGEVPAGEAIRRSTASEGDDIYVSGVIGDAALAVAEMQGIFSPAAPGDHDHFVARYRLPQPRTELGPALRGTVRAAIDVSDGLAGDLGHICETSGVSARIEAARVPLSAPAKRALASNSNLMRTVLTGGDDYELLFTADPAARDTVFEIALRCAVPVVRIGRIDAGTGVRAVDGEGRDITLESAGYRHF